MAYAISSSRGDRSTQRAIDVPAHSRRPSCYHDMIALDRNTGQHHFEFDPRRYVPGVYLPPIGIGYLSNEQVVALWKAFENYGEKHDSNIYVGGRLYRGGLIMQMLAGSGIVRKLIIAETVHRIETAERVIRDAKRLSRAVDGSVDSGMTTAAAILKARDELGTDGYITHQVEVRWNEMETRVVRSYYAFAAVVTGRRDMRNQHEKAARRANNHDNGHQRRGIAVAGTDNERRYTGASTGRMTSGHGPLAPSETPNKRRSNGGGKDRRYRNDD